MRSQKNLPHKFLVAPLFSELGRANLHFVAFGRGKSKSTQVVERRF